MSPVFRRAAATAACALLPSLAAAQHGMSHMENPKHENSGKNLPNTLNIGARVGLSLWH